MDEQKIPTPAIAPSQSYNALYTPVSIILAGLFIGGGLFLGLSHQVKQANGNTTGTPAQTAVDVKEVKTAGAPFIGKIDAPITLAFWSDFQCPYCKAVEVGGIPQIPTTPAIPSVLKDYVATGKVKIVFKDFPFLGNDSITAAEYARSIWALYPDQYYAWRIAMYQSQDEEGDKGFGNAATIDSLIKKSFSNIDDSKVKADITTNKDKYDAEIAADKDEGASLGVNGTPGFITGTTLISGAQEYPTFKKAFDSQTK